MPRDLGHPDGCGCAVCRRHRERLATDLDYAEKDHYRKEYDRRLSEQAWRDDTSTHRYPELDDLGRREPGGSVERVHVEHVHHYEASRGSGRATEPRESPAPAGAPRTVVVREKAPRPRPAPRHRARRRGGFLRTAVAFAFLVAVLHSFYPHDSGLDVPFVPGVSCESSATGPGTSAAAYTSAYKGGATVQTTGLGSTLGDLAGQTVASAAKAVALAAVGGAIHLAGQTIDEFASHPPAPVDIYHGLIADARLVGSAEGWVQSAFTGTSVADLPGTTLPNLGLVPLADCGTCPGVVAPASAIDSGKVSAPAGIATAAKAAVKAGWSTSDAVTAVAIAGPESRYDPNAANSGSTARGMWQTMMSYHQAKYAGASWRDPYANARVAHQIWADAKKGPGGSWSPWVGWTSGAYRSYLPAARAAVHRVEAATSVVNASYASPVAPSTLVDGKRVSVVAARQLALAEKISGIDMTVVQGGYGGGHVAASGTSHNYPGVMDVVPGTVAVEKALRQVGFAAWARNIPGRSSVGSGAHVHAVSLLDTGDKGSPQVYGSWAHDGNGLAGTNNDPAPHYPWIANLATRVGGTPLASTDPGPVAAAVAATSVCAGTGATGTANASTIGATAPGGGALVPGRSVAARTGGRSFGLATFNVLGESHHRQGPAASRMRLTVDRLAAHGVDLVGLQEFQGGQAADFRTMAGGTYGVCSARGNTENSVAYRRSVFQLVSCRSTSISYFHGVRKPMALARLRFRPTGGMVTVLSVHNPGNVAWAHHQRRFRDAATREEVALLGRLRASTSDQVYVVGDVNDVHDGTGWTGPMRASGMRGVEAPGRQAGGIDKVYGSPNTRVQAWTSDRGAVVRAASDHPMVVAQVAAPVATGQAGGN